MPPSAGVPAIRSVAVASPIVAAATAPAARSGRNPAPDSLPAGVKAAAKNATAPNASQPTWKPDPTLNTSVPVSAGNAEKTKSVSPAVASAVRRSRSARLRPCLKLATSRPAPTSAEVAMSVSTPALAPGASRWMGRGIPNRSADPASTAPAWTAARFIQRSLRSVAARAGDRWPGAATGAVTRTGPVDDAIPCDDSHRAGCPLAHADWSSRGSPSAPPRIFVDVAASCIAVNLPRGTPAPNGAPLSLFDQILGK